MFIQGEVTFLAQKYVNINMNIVYNTIFMFDSIHLLKCLATSRS